MAEGGKKKEKRGRKSEVLVMVKLLPEGRSEKRERKEEANSLIRSALMARPKRGGEKSPKKEGRFAYPYKETKGGEEI